MRQIIDYFKMSFKKEHASDLRSCYPSILSELMELQESLPEKYQEDAKFNMSYEAWEYIKKAKDLLGNHIFDKNGTFLLGKPVCIGNIPPLHPNGFAITYGNSNAKRTLTHHPSSE